RSYIDDGSMQKLIDQGIKGVTSNPAIFEQAIAGSNDYDSLIISLTGEGMSALEIYDALSIQDVGDAADLFRPVYDSTNGLDGYVSLEVSPHLAHDTEGTIADARRLWAKLNRPNVMIKIPATKAGIPAIKQALIEGININVTLLFSVERYREVAVAYVEAMAERKKQGLELKVASVASFFVSRVDGLVDKQLEASDNPESSDLFGMAAIANSRIAYGVFEEVFGTDEWKEVEAAGAWKQRLLWASTSTKNPDYSPVLYVDQLVGPDTVNTMPLNTIDSYLEHGDPADRLSGTVRDAEITLSKVEACGIDMNAVTQKLEDDGIAKFVEPFDQLIDSIETKRQSIYA
ncbi:MAG: transaldolase, partial [Armatimonadetes bacterium]|nr:transaldolase [Armatimonadota bacterium]